MFEDIKKRVCEANKRLFYDKVVILTWGNVSEVDDERSVMVIKPSGVSYDEMTPEDMVVVDLETEKVVEGKYRPSTDAPTHLKLYREYKDMKAIVHTHSTFAVGFAQAGINVPILGTTHADYFYGDVLCTRELSESEVKTDYEKNTANVIIETINKKNYDVVANPGILVKNHGVFTWGKSANKAVENAFVLEEISKMAYLSLQLNKNSNINQYIVEKHYERKHGKNAYYGQK